MVEFTTVVLVITLVRKMGTGFEYGLVAYSIV